MAFKVGIYEPQVGPTLANPVRLSQVPDSGLSGIAKGLSDLGSAQYKLETDLDHQRVEDLRNKLYAQDEADRQKIQTFKGDKALAAVDGGSPFAPIRKARESVISDLASTLGNDRQRAMFQRVAAEHDGKLDAYTEAWKGAEQKAWNTQVNIGKLSTGLQEVQRNPISGGVWQEQLQRGEEAVAAEFGSGPPELFQAKLSEMRSSLFGARLIALSDPKTGAPWLAKDLVKDYPNMLVGEHRASILRLVNEGSGEMEVQATVNSLPPNVSGPAADQVFRDTAGDDSKLLGELRKEFAIREGIREGEVKKVQGTLLGLYEGSGGIPKTKRKEIRWMPGYTKMTLEAQNHLETLMDQYDKRHEGKEDPKVTLARYGKTLDLSNSPATLAKLGDEQLIAMGLGDENTKFLMRAKRGLEGKLSKLENVDMKAGDFTAALDKWEIKHKNVKGKDAANLGAFKMEFAKRVVAEQLKLNRPLDEMEFNAVIDGMAKKVKLTKSGYWFGMFDKTDESRAWEVDAHNTAEAEKPFESLAMLKLQKNGVEATPENIGAMVAKIKAAKIDPVDALTKLGATVPKSEPNPTSNPTTSPSATRPVKLMEFTSPPAIDNNSRPARVVYNDENNPTTAAMNRQIEADKEQKKEEERLAREKKAIAAAMKNARQ